MQGRSREPALEWAPGAIPPVTSTFGEIEARSNRLARELDQRGLHMGDRLCAYLKNRSEFIDLYLACLKLGITFVPINTLYREREISYIISNVDPAALIAEEPITVPCPVWRLADLITAASLLDSTRLIRDVDGTAPALIMYTSGTTGRAKGVVLTHNNLAANTLSLLTLWQISPSDRFLLSLPLFHLHGLGVGLHCWIASGCRMRLLERFEQRTTEDTFLSFRPTLFFGVPTMYVRLNQLAAAAEIGEFMRLFVCGSAPLPVQVLEEFRSRFNHTILERYGMTETLINMSNPYIGERRPGSVGLPVAGVSVRLLDEKGVPVKEGEVGQVHVRGSNVFAGYWRNYEATDHACSEGYFRTGDLAIRSGNGYFDLQGRASDLIISGGYNIYPREIEDFLNEQPEIAEATVVGLEDSLWGQVPVAFVVAASEVDPSELKLRCKSSMASFKAPHHIVVVESLPRNALGKVDKRELINLKPINPA